MCRTPISAPTASMGTVFSQMFPPKSLFSIAQVPDLTGRVIIVTGGNTGLGRETCKALLNKNAKVYMTARNRDKADEAIEWLKQETGGREPVFLELDLANLGCVRKCAEEFKSKEELLHVLLNNAGVAHPPIEKKTVDGYDLQFGTNVLGHYFLTMLLLPTLIHTAKVSPLACGYARVLNMSSQAVYLAPKGGIAWDTLGTDAASDAECRRIGLGELYGQSKLANILLSNELAKRYSDQGIISISINPGNLKTDLLRHLSRLKVWFLDFLRYPISFGVLTLLWSATVPDMEKHNGKFVIPWARIGDPGPDARNEKNGEQLWVWLNEQVKDH